MSEQKVLKKITTLDKKVDGLAKKVGTLEKDIKGIDKRLDFHDEMFTWIKKEVATKKDFERFATKEDLSGFATKEDLDRFATKKDLEGFATKDDFNQMMDVLDRLVVIADRQEVERVSLIAWLKRHEVQIETNTRDIRQLAV